MRGESVGVADCVAYHPHPSPLPAREREVATAACWWSSFVSNSIARRVSQRDSYSIVPHNFVSSCRACAARQLTGAWYAPCDFTAHERARHGTRTGLFESSTPDDGALIPTLCGLALRLSRQFLSE